jgi:hypothetical protein
MTLAVFGEFTSVLENEYFGGCEFWNSRPCGCVHVFICVPKSVRELFQRVWGLGERSDTYMALTERL